MEVDFYDVMCGIGATFAIVAMVMITIEII